MLSDRIKNLRTEKGITQKQLADALNVGQSTIGMIERGERGASNDLLIKFSDFFRVSVDYLLGKESDDSLELAAAKPFVYSLISFLNKNVSYLKKRINDFLNNYGYDYIEDEFTFDEAKKFYHDKLMNYGIDEITSEIHELGLSYKINEEKKIVIFDENIDKTISVQTKSIEKDLPVIPEEFTDPEEARAYVEKHQIFGSDGFDPDRLDDKEILEFANALLEQMKMVSYKYRK